MASSDKQRIVAKLLAQIPKFLSEHIPDNLSVLDHLLLGVLQEDTCFTLAAAAYERLRVNFFDFNELRVSHPRELLDYLADLPDAERKARCILEILQFIFETTYAFDLEAMKRKPLKQAHKQLSKIAGASDFAVAAAVQRSLGGHALPIDSPMHDLLTRLKLADASDTLEQVRTAMEHFVPKTKGIEFCLALSSVAADASQQPRFLQAVRNARRGRPPSNSETQSSGSEGTSKTAKAVRANAQKVTPPVSVKRPSKGSG